MTCWFNGIGVATIAKPRSRPKWALYLQRKNSEGPMAHPFGFVTIAKASGTQFGHSSNTVDTQLAEFGRSSDTIQKQLGQRSNTLDTQLKQSSDADGTQFRHSWDTNQTQLRHSSDTIGTEFRRSWHTVGTQFRTQSGRSSDTAQAQLEQVGT